MILTFIVFVLLVAGASAAAHHSGGHDGGGGGKSDAGGSGGGAKDTSKANGNSAKSSSNSDPPSSQGGGNGKANAPKVTESKAKAPKSQPQVEANPAPKLQVETAAPAVDIEPDPEPPQRDSEPPAAEQQPAKEPQASESEVETVQAEVEDDVAQPRTDPVEAKEIEPPATTGASQDVDRTVDNTIDRARDAEPAARNRVEEPVAETIPEIEPDDTRTGIDKLQETQGTQEDASAEDDAPKTIGGGAKKLAHDTLDKAALSSAGLPVIGLTYWVDDDMIYLLADPVPADDNLSGLPQYQWLWPDGTTTIGGAYQTHRLADGMEQYIVTVIRLDTDGVATHETTEWIDLTFYWSNHADASHHAAYGDGSPEVYALGEDLRPVNPKKNSDIGAAIESVPAPPLVPVIGLLGMVAWWRRRT